MSEQILISNNSTKKNNLHVIPEITKKDYNFQEEDVITVKLADNTMEKSKKPKFSFFRNLGRKKKDSTDIGRYLDDENEMIANQEANGEVWDWENNGVEDENDDDAEYIDNGIDLFKQEESPFFGWDDEIDKNEGLERHSELVSKLEEKLPSFKKVLTSNLTEQEKEECMWLVAILLDPEARFDEHYVSTALKINRTLEYNSKMESEKIKYYTDMEKKFMDIMVIDKPIKNKIFDLPVDDNLKKIIFQHYYQNNVERSEKESKWLDVVLNIPWGNFLKIDVPAPMKIMDEWNKDVEGMIPAKEEFLLTLNDYTTNPNINPKILTLKGVPGCGKTLFMQSISKILGLPIQWIDLAGMNEANFLKGFSKTWEGSKVGRLVEAVINMGCMNGIIALEEIDKIESKTSHGKEALDCLVPILDRTRNHEFYDNYLSDIPVPLNNIIFVATCNDDKDFPEYLRNRLNIIDIPKPDMDKKINIAKNYILPSALKERNISSDDVLIDNNTIKYIIEHFTKEEGVRELKERIQSIIQRINFFIRNHDHVTQTSNNKKEMKDVSIIFPNNFQKPFVITPTLVDSFLKNQKTQKTNLTYFM
jgi:ATP-dependent Lon protease